MIAGFAIGIAYALGYYASDDEVVGTKTPKHPSGADVDGAAGNWAGSGSGDGVPETPTSSPCGSCEGSAGGVPDDCGPEDPAKPKPPVGMPFYREPVSDRAAAQIPPNLPIHASLIVARLAPDRVILRMPEISLVDGEPLRPDDGTVLLDHGRVEMTVGRRSVTLFTLPATTYTTMEAKEDVGC